MTPARAARITAFLATTKWRDAIRSDLAGDASNRRYERLNDPNLGSAVLMDAPPETGEDIAPFVKIAKHLESLDLSAPELYAFDARLGLMLLEDLGDALFARHLEHHLEQEEPLYHAAIDTLVAAQKAAPPPDLPKYGVPEMTIASGLALDWYARFATDDTPTDQTKKTFQDLVRDSLEAALCTRTVLVQRDYHAENLLWLPDRDGPARVGLLDFQDAALGPASYDLASLLVDIRREVSAETCRSGIAHFLDQTGYEAEAFHFEFSTLSAQRNLRILGVFTRLCVRDGKSDYPDMIAQVWANLQNDLSHPKLDRLRDVVNQHLPAPNPAIVARIKASHVSA